MNRLNMPELRRTALLALCATAAFSFAAHGFLFANEFFSHDSVSYFTYATGTSAFYTGIGRFAIPLYESIKGDVAAPWLIGLLFILWMTLTAVLVTELLGIRSRSGMVLTCGLLCTNLALTLTGATYVYCMDEYAFALCAAAAAAWCFARGRWWMPAGLVALVFALVYACFGGHIVALLTSLPALRELADRYILWQVVLPVVGVWCYLLDGMFIGATRGAEMRNSMAVAAAGFGLTLLTLPYLGNHGLWLALAVFLSLRGLSLAVIWHRHWRNNTWFPAPHDIS